MATSNLFQTATRFGLFCTVVFTLGLATSANNEAHGTSIMAPNQVADVAVRAPVALKKALMKAGKALHEGNLDSANQQVEVARWSLESLAENRHDIPEELHSLWKLELEARRDFEEQHYMLIALANAADTL
jgi:hypothetical protein